MFDCSLRFAVPVPRRRLARDGVDVADVVQEEVSMRYARSHAEICIVSESSADAQRTVRRCSWLTPSKRSLLLGASIVRFGGSPRGSARAAANNLSIVAVRVGTGSDGGGRTMPAEATALCAAVVERGAGMGAMRGMDERGIRISGAGGRGAIADVVRWLASSAIDWTPITAAPDAISRRCKCSSQAS